LQAVISFGASLLGALLGRKKLSVTNVTRAGTAARGVGRSMKEAGDVAHAQENVKALQEQQAALETEFQAETDALASRIDPASEELETVVVKPKKTNITVRLVALTWAPHWQDAAGKLTMGWQ
jgi:hypothetical protein